MFELGIGLLTEDDVVALEDIASLVKSSNRTDPVGESITLAALRFVIKTLSGIEKIQIYSLNRRSDGGLKESRRRSGAFDGGDYCMVIDGLHHSTHLAWRTKERASPTASSQLEPRQEIILPQYHLRSCIERRLSVHHRRCLLTAVSV